MDQKKQQAVTTEHESVPMVPDLDFLMAIAFRDNDEPGHINPDNIS